MTAAQQRREKKKRRALERRILESTHPYVRCLGCGYVFFDIDDDSYGVDDPEFKWSTPCPQCGHEEAEYALSLEEWDELCRNR